MADLKVVYIISLIIGVLNVKCDNMVIRMEKRTREEMLSSTVSYIL